MESELEFKVGDIIVPIGSLRKHVVLDVCDKGVLVDELNKGNQMQKPILLSTANYPYYVRVGKWHPYFGEVKDD